MTDPLIWARAVHFASTVLLSGTVFFLGFIAEPAVGKFAREGELGAAVLARLVFIAWTSVPFVLLSGVAWFVLETAQIADLPVGQVFAGPAALTVLTQTDFGRVWGGRLLMLAALVATLAPFGATHRIGPRRRLVSIPLAAAVVGMLAWAGHGAAGLGISGSVQLAADVLHLVGAAAWVGALIPLAVTLSAACRCREESSLAVAQSAIVRFSTLGIASVATLLLTGFVNSWMLVGNVSALFETSYGRLMLVKIALFAAMVSLAAANRMILTPRVLQANAGLVRMPLHQLMRNSLIEAGLGSTILVIVSVLGTLPPGIEEMAQ